MVTEPFFSIIIPLYNSERYISAAIQSVMSQTFNDWELIIIDDGSKDSGREIAAEYASADPRIMLVQHENGKNNGVSATRNLGLKHACGQWISFLDADDVWFPEKLEKQHLIIREFDNNLVFLYSQAKIIDNKGIELTTDTIPRYNRKKQIFGYGKPGLAKKPYNKVIDKDFEVPTSSVTVRMETIEQNKITFRENLSNTEDAIFFFDIIQYGDVYFSDQPLIYYRIHETQWNARTGTKVKTGRRLLLYTELIKSCLPEYRNKVSFLLVNKGLRLVISGCLSPRMFNLPLIFNSYKQIWTGKISCYYKFLSVLVGMSELLILPVRWIRVIIVK